MAVLAAIIIVVFLLVLVVLVHESAHAITASLLGIPYDMVQVGIPLPLKVTITIRGTEMRLRPWLQKRFTLGEKTISVQPWLFGGGVNIKDEDLFNAPYWKMALVVLAGPLANFVTGLMAAILAFGLTAGGQVALEFTSAAYQSLVMIAKGDVSWIQLVGPIGLIAIASYLVKIEPLLGTVFVWLLLSFVTAVINLAPIPALDGGFIVFGSASPLSGKSPRVISILKTANVVFFFLLFGVLVALTIKDIVLLIRGGIQYLL